MIQPAHTHNATDRNLFTFIIVENKDLVWYFQKLPSGLFQIIYGMFIRSNNHM